MNSILHIGNIAGVPQELARAQRKLGFKSDVLSFDQHPFGYEIDLYYPTKLPTSSRYLRYVWVSLRFSKKMFNLLKNSTKYDILHFHSSSVLPFGMDLPIWKMLKKKVIIHHHGSDIRYKQEFKMYLKFADKILVSTPDLLEWSPTAIWIPNPISLDDFSYYGVDYKDKSECVNIVHAPSNRMKKGTEYVINAVNKLKSEGYNINLILVENMSHHKAIEFYKNADIVIDQLLIGWYGVFSIECMALGKPVCVYIHDDLESYVPLNSILNISPKNITENMRVLIENLTLRKEIGDRGRKFVEEVHDSKKIAKQLHELYASL